MLDEHTDIRIEARLNEHVLDCDGHPAFEYTLCYTNLAGQAVRVTLDATTAMDAKFEAVLSLPATTSGEKEIEIEYE